MLFANVVDEQENQDIPNPENLVAEKETWENLVSFMGCCFWKSQHKGPWRWVKWYPKPQHDGKEKSPHEDQFCIRNINHKEWQRKAKYEQTSLRHENQSDSGQNSAFSRMTQGTGQSQGQSCIWCSQRVCPAVILYLGQRLSKKSSLPCVRCWTVHKWVLSFPLRLNLVLSKRLCWVLRYRWL